MIYKKKCLKVFKLTGVGMHNSCLDRTEFFPPEAPRWCDQKPTSTFAQICCYDREMCNDGLTPELTSIDTESDVTVEGGAGK